jgi:hypothetical protein
MRCHTARREESKDNWSNYQWNNIVSRLRISLKIWKCKHDLITPCQTNRHKVLKGLLDERPTFSKSYSCGILLQVANCMALSYSLNIGEQEYMLTALEFGNF